MAITLLSSLNEGIMGLVEKHSVYSKPLICFSMRIPILSNFSILRKYMVWFSVPPYFPSNERCSFESAVRTMKRFFIGKLKV
jgi:hypothetical protein